MAVIADYPPLGRTLTDRKFPRTWQQQRFGPCGFVYELANGMTVIESDGGETAHGEWLHVSASFPDRMPSWDDLGMLKRILIGPDADAIIVLPKQRQYVNIHPNCLHLWHRLDGDSAPQFAREVAPGRFTI